MSNVKVLPNKADFAFLNRPSDKEMEKLVISCFILMGRVAIKRYYGIIQEKWFTDIVYRRIFRVATEMYQEGLEIEFSILRQRLQAIAGWDEIQDGDERLQLTLDEGIRLENIDNYVGILSEQFRLRMAQDVLMDAWKDVSQKPSRSNATNSISIISKAVNKLQEVAAEGVLKSGHTLGQIAVEQEKRRLEIAARQELYTGIQSGFKPVDEMTLGFQNGDLIILAGRPSMGKTASAVDIILNASEIYPKKTFIFESVEMSKEAIYERFISKKTGINLAKLRAPARLSEDEFRKIKRASESLMDSNIVILDSTDSLDEAVMGWHRIADKRDVGGVVIDYLQLLANLEMQSVGNNMYLAGSKTGKRVKKTAKDLRIPIIALSQVSRRCEERPNQRPLLSDLSESGTIEQDADVVIFIFRPAVYDPELENNRVELIVAKQRNGPTGTALLAFTPSTATISNLEAKHIKEQQLLTSEIKASLKK